jgi:hypothetical protein
MNTKMKEQSYRLMAFSLYFSLALLSIGARGRQVVQVPIQDANFLAALRGGNTKDLRSVLDLSGQQAEASLQAAAGTSNDGSVVLNLAQELRTSKPVQLVFEDGKTAQAGGPIPQDYVGKAVKMGLILLAKPELLDDGNIHREVQATLDIALVRGDNQRHVVPGGGFEILKRLKGTLSRLGSNSGRKFIQEEANAIASMYGEHRDALDQQHQE